MGPSTRAQQLARVLRPGNNGNPIEGRSRKANPPKFPRGFQDYTESGPNIWRLFDFWSRQRDNT